MGGATATGKFDSIDSIVDPIRCRCLRLVGWACHDFAWNPGCVPTPTPHVNGRRDGFEALNSGAWTHGVVYRMVDPVLALLSLAWL